MKGKITKTAIADLAEGQTLWDTQTPGLGVRRRSTGAVFIVKGRLNGRQRWWTIGKAGAPWTPHTARIRALEMLADIANGRDPAGPRDDGLTVAGLIERWMTGHVRPRRKVNTAADYQGLIDRHITPRMGRIPAKALTVSDVSALHEGLAEKPHTANRALAVLSAAYNWAVKREIVARNPAAAVSKYREEPRRRYLSAAELTRLGEALDAGVVSWQMAALVRLLLLTGARHSEIASLRWPDIDLANGRAVLHDSKTGARVLRLPAAAVAAIASLPRYDNGTDWLLPSDRGDGHVWRSSKAWAALCKAALIDNARIHDLRHTFASIGASAGLSLPQIGALLGHSQPQTTARYAHLIDDQQARDSDAIGALVADGIKSRSNK